MRRLYLFIPLLGFLATSLMAQPPKSPTPPFMTVAAFNTLLREVDLNAYTQNGFSITKSEYTELMDVWQQLPETDRLSLLNADDGWKDFVKMLLFDLSIGERWENYIRKAARYGAKGLAITVSRQKNLLSLKQARETLVDLLQEGPPLLVHGRLVISERIKTQAKARAGEKALKRLNLWEALINHHRNASDMKKLKAVSDFFLRQLRQASDPGQAQGYDYWQSPIETLVRGKGDCDDFTMAQYISLRLLGIPADRLRVGLVRHPYLGGHSVVLYYPPGELDPWVLDNLASDRFGTSFGRILRLSVRMRFDHLQPLWAMNETLLAEYRDGRHEFLLPDDPREAFPAFAIALMNSQRLMPPAGSADEPHLNAMR